MTNEMIDVASKELWDRAKAIYLSTIQGDDDRNQVERYFSMITSVTREANVFTIFTSNALAADLLTKDYSNKLRSCFDLAGGDKDLRLEFRFDENRKHTFVVPEEVRQTPTMKNGRVSTFVSTMPMKDDYTFDEFVEGPSNSWAAAAAKGAAKDPGKKGFNPLFIHGGTGLGKTHIMQAIGNEVRNTNPMASVCYLTAERFLTEYVTALSNKGDAIRQFNDRYRNIDVLLVDDIQFMSRGKDFQGEFFNIFNALHDAGKQIVMTSDVAPKDLPGIEARLISRFEWGMVQEIEKPSYETRLAILKKKAEGLNRSISDSTLKFIAQNIKSHVRAMEGALGKVTLMQDLNPNIVFTDEILSNLLKDSIEKEKSLKKLTIEEIQAAVAKRYQVDMDKILSNERTQTIVTPRQLAMYISRKFTTRSLPEIAQKFNKTHATILHGVKTIIKRLDVEPELRESLDSLLAEFGYSKENMVN